MNTDYIGEELAHFQYATNWKRYFSAFLRPYVRGAVAEVGAGMGANVSYLLNEAVSSYRCIEPDDKLAAIIEEKITTGELPRFCSVQRGYLESTVREAFDTILYIDVLEHIEEDTAEVQKAATALKPGGHLCVLVPANPEDYTAFDKAIGHYRRYTKDALIKTVQPSLPIEWCRYLDSFGSFASKMNRFLLKQSAPSKGQVLLWDRCMIPVSRILDKPTGYRRGKSLLLVAQKKQG